MDKIYLDYNASTPILPEVFEEMEVYFQQYFGNPSASHWASRDSKEAIYKARCQVAKLIGCEAEEIIFTSGGSEANNHALKGVYQAMRESGNHIITSKVEHPAILSPCAYLESLGVEVTYLDVDSNGRVDPNQVEEQIKENTILISVMHANNEVGTIQPIEAISEIAKRYGIIFHTDAAQSLGKIPVNVKELGVDLLTIAGHKLYAPKGIGALYIKRGTPIESFIHGAGHEGGKRAGTENTPYVVALGKASELADKNDNQMSKVKELRNYFWTELNNAFSNSVVINGELDNALPNTLSVSFIGMEGEKILERVPEIAASTGSACHAGQIELSSVLKAMGVSEHVGMGAVRFSLGRDTTMEEIDFALRLLKERVKMD